MSDERGKRRKRMRRFDNPDDLMAYLKDSQRESACVLKAQQLRPLRKQDQLFRATTVVDGKAFWYSIVHRADGSIEFWLKRYTDEDADIADTTHRGFTLATILGRKD